MAVKQQKAAPAETHEQRRAREAAEEQQHYNAVMAKIAVRLSEITSTVPAERLLAFMDAMQVSASPCSPAETLIVDLLDVFMWKRLCPETVHKAVEEFKLNWQDAVDDASRFQARYPDALALYEQGRALMEQPAA